MRDQARAPRTYELMTILHPEVPEEEIPGALDRIASHLTGHGGEVTETLRDSPWGRRRLAYPIRFGGRDLRDGYYTVYHFQMPPNGIEAMEQDLKLNTQVIRYLVTTYEPKPLDPRAIEDAEIAAEDAAAAAYAAAQAEAARAAEAAQRAAAQAAAAAAAAVPTEPAGGAEPPEASAEVASEAAAAPEAQPVVAPEPEVAPQPEAVGDNEDAAGADAADDVTAASTANAETDATVSPEQPDEPEEPREV